MQQKVYKEPRKEKVSRKLVTHVRDVVKDLPVTLVDSSNQKSYRVLLWIWNSMLRITLRSTPGNIDLGVNCVRMDSTNLTSTPNPLSNNFTPSYCYYRPHPKDGEGTVFSLFVSLHLNGGYPITGPGGEYPVSGLGGGVPHPRSGQGVSHPADGGGYPIPGLDRGYPIQLTGGIPSQVQVGIPHPADWGVLHPRSGWEGVPQGTPQPGLNGVPPGQDW